MAYLQKGRRGGVVLVNDKYIYQKNKAKQAKIYWRCWRTDCRAGITTNNFGAVELDREPAPVIRILKVDDHGHLPDTPAIETGRIMQEMRKNISANPTVPIKRVYNYTVSNVGPGGDADEDRYIPSYKSVSSAMERHRTSMLPPIPHSIDDVNPQGEWALTWDSTQFLSLNDHNWGVLVFCTDDDIQRLSRCSTIYMDGTFKSAPWPYAQFVTIHGLFLGRSIPFVYALLEDKVTGSYRLLINHVKLMVRRLTGRRWRPRKVVTDFELSLLNAVESELPNTQNVGCYFHFTQSLWRRVQELGLAGPYRRHLHVKKCIRKFMSIGYLPIPLIRMNIRLHIQQSARVINRYPAIRDFANYIQRNYIQGGASFPIPMWNVYDRNNNDRTNNNVEVPLVSQTSGMGEAEDPVTRTL